MDTFTDLSIASAVQQIIEDEHPVKLNTFAFKYGSIKPDISPALIKIPHYLDDSIGFIKHQIKQLFNFKINTYTNCTKHFSEKLGIIIHYLADFFCYAHSAHYKGGMLEHCIYEINLSKYFKINPTLLKDPRTLQFIHICKDYESIFRYIDEQYEKYINMTPSYFVDTNFALSVSITVSLSIISACITEKSMKAAG